MPGGLFDNLPVREPPTHRSPTEADQVTLATAVPEQGLQTDSDLESVPEKVGLQPVIGEYLLVNTVEKLDAMLATLRKQLTEVYENGHRPAWLAVDTETDALGSMASNLCGISLSAKEGTGFYIPVKGAIEDVLDEARWRDRLRAASCLTPGHSKSWAKNLKCMTSTRCVISGCRSTALILTRWWLRT